MKLGFPFKRLGTGLWLTYLLLIAGSLGLMAWRIGSSLDASRFAETKRDQEGRAILAASAASEWLTGYLNGRIDQGTLQIEIESFSRVINQRVSVLDANGVVLVDAEHPLQVGVDDSDAPEIAAAFDGITASTVRYDFYSQENALFTVAPVKTNKRLIGFVRLDLPMHLVQEATMQLWVRILGATVLAGLVTVIISVLFARALTNPLAQITRASTALANGDLKQRIQVTGPEELQGLAAGFNFMAERIERVMEEQRAFVANAAHELRTPLTTIRLRAEALSEGAKDDPAVASEFLGDIVNESDRLTRIVNQLLDLSRIETGLVERHRESVDLPAIAHEVLDESSRAQPGIAMEVIAPADLPRVSVDPDQMRQVFINLLENAIKFTPPGGSIRMSFKRTRTSRGDERLSAGDWLTVSIADTGAGIAAEDLPHIFKSFYRGDKSRTRASVATASGGTGLGLAIVKGIVNAHRGHIWVESQVGKGSVFTFALPI